MARARTNYLFYLGIVGVLLQIPAFLIGVKWGVEGVAAGHLVASLITAVIAFTVVLGLLGRGTRHFLRAVGVPVAFSAAMALGVFGSKAALSTESLPAILQLVTLTLIGAVIYTGLAWVFARKSLYEVARFFRRRRR